MDINSAFSIIENTLIISILFGFSLYFWSRY